MSTDNGGVQGTFWQVPPEKRCHGCGKVKPLDQFPKRGRCRECKGKPPDAWPESKRCPACKEVKPISEFTGQHREQRGGKWYWTYCRCCNSGKCREQLRKRIASGKARADNRRRYKKRRWERLLAQYGVTQEQYEKMESDQCGLCVICRQPETKTYKGVLCRLVVDHDHKTGKVRGLLCRSCNVAIGNLKDDPEVAQRATDYLRSNKGN